MTEFKFHLSRAAVLAVMLGLAACTSSPEVRDLAEKTAANTGSLALAIDTMSRQSRALAERRAANAARLSAVTARVESRMELDLALLQKSGDSAANSTLQTLKTWSAKVREIHAKAATDQAELIRAFLEKREDIKSKSTALSEVAGILASLARDESLKSRATFLFGYGKAVYEEVKKRQKEAEAAIKSGEKKLAATETGG